MYTAASNRWIMTGPDLIQVLSILIEIIIATGAVFIAAKKQKTFWLGSCCHVCSLTCASISHGSGSSRSAGMDAFLFLIANIAMLIAVWLMIQER